MLLWPLLVVHESSRGVQDTVIFSSHFVAFELDRLPIFR